MSGRPCWGVWGGAGGAARGARGWLSTRLAQPSRSAPQAATDAPPLNPDPLPPPSNRILRQVAGGSEKGLQAEVLKRDFSQQVRAMAARTGAGT